MKPSTIVICAVAIFCLAAAVLAVDVTSGTVTRVDRSMSGYSLVSLACATDAGGDVQALSKEFFGQILRVTLAPNSSSALAPTNLYDVTLTDIDGVDVFAGLGMNCSSAAAKTFCPMVGDGATSVPMTAYGALTLRVDNGGAANWLTIRILTRP